jgi:hypothetical protein
MSAERSEQPDVLDSAVNAAIAACDGDARATIRALIVANSFLTEQVDTLTKELDWAWHWISPGYTRSTNKRRMKSGDPD